MTNKSATIASLTTMIAGPSLAAAEAGGVFGEVGHALFTYIMSGALFVLGGMMTMLVWFIKREHASITGDIKSTKDGIHSIKGNVQAIALDIESIGGDLRTELAKRVTVQDFGESMNRLHEKINAIGRAVDYLRGKLQLPPSDADKGEEL